MRTDGRFVVALCCTLLLATSGATAAPPAASGKSDGARTPSSSDTPADVLSPEQWRRVDAAVNRALIWLASQQQQDGRFPAYHMGQPGVTSLCTLAFMAHGHGPGDG